MSTEPSHPCAWPRCPNLTRRQFCNEHEAADRRRKQVTVGEDGGAFLDSSRWRKLRLMVLRRFPLCRLCGAGATEVDHVIPRSDRPDLAATPSNLQSLCKRCHSRKTMAERPSLA